MAKDYYHVLGVSKNASPEDIKRAYRTLAHQHHPDKKGGNETKFKEINEAYQVLGDEKKRAQYDQFGSTFSSQGGGPSGGGWDFSGFSQGQGFEGAGFGDIFEDLFAGFSGRGFGGRNRQKRGDDLSMEITLAFTESIFGVYKSVTIDHTALCDACQGSGAEQGAKKKKCDTCNGTGTVRENKRSLFGNFTSLSECRTCRGRGEIPEKQCRACSGSGIARKREQISIDIPAGIAHGEMLKLTGKGEATTSGSAGDLYIKIRVTPHSLFRREDDALLCDMSLPVTTLLLGGEEKLETLDGAIVVKIPELSHAGDTLRVKGKGVPTARGGRGDLFIRLKEKLPKKLSSSAKKLLSDLKKEGI